MSLADHWDGGWLQAGWHQVKVADYELKPNPKTGNNGVEFAFMGTSTGGRAKDMFWLTEAAFWRLAAFARACGMTRTEAASYEPTNPNDHRKLVGLECWVELVKKGEYHEVVGWRSLTEGEAPPPKIDRSAEMTTAQEANDAEADADDCPF